MLVKRGPWQPTRMLYFSKLNFFSNLIRYITFKNKNRMLLSFVSCVSSPKQNGRHFADDMFECIFLNENVWIPIEISLKFVPNGSINNNPALFQIMAWRRPGDKPLFEPMMESLLTHICVTRPQWVNTQRLRQDGQHFPDNIFWMLFLESKLLYFDSNCMEICSQRFK